MNKSKNLLGLILPVLLLITWFVITETKLIPPYLLPSPKRVLLVTLDFLTGRFSVTSYGGTLVSHLLASVGRVLIGFVIASLVGVTLGFLTGKSQRMRAIVEPTIHGIRAIPGIGWLPLALVWFGVGQTTTVFLIALASFFPIYVNSTYGVTNVPETYIQAGSMLGANRKTMITKVIIPAAFPSVLVGLRLGLGIGWAYLVLGELTGVSKGLGAVMMDSRMLGQSDMIIVTMIIIGVLGKLSDILLVKTLGRLYLGGDREAGQ